MLRVHLTTEDLLRVRVAPTVGPLAEAYHSLEALTGPGGCAQFRPWRQKFGGGPLAEEIRPLASLIPGPGPCFDLGALTGTDTSVQEGLDRLLGAPDELVRLELGHVATPRADPRWIRALKEGDLTARQRLADSVAACHRLTVGPYWGRIQAHLDAVRADLARALLGGGVEQLLGTFCAPTIRWQAPVLEIGYPRSVDVHLGGRGLVLAPMVFLADPPVLLTDSLDRDAPAVLAFPTVRDPLAGARLWSEDPTARQSLTALLGRTRAAALDIVTEGCTTTELARRLNVSPASASQHATVLRNAHLITTQRRGGAVLHSITALGIDLLNRAAGGPAPVGAPGRTG
ncbi:MULTISPECIES: helix-turn-helix transcriptional regulator [unclassified Kitasatospora]|uniref:ArsR/SmtB family transcription factor n=1 Tax=unclassified Kitasatospora TaxID=2633591 RepID=UPI0007C82FA1|nr:MULTISPECIES: winged helix-turn-helix domain-containing protein [unclassified Kitasatospora]